MSRALLPSWVADSQPGPGPAPSVRAEMAGRLARHPLVWDVAVAAAVASPGEFAWREDSTEKELERRICDIPDKPGAALFPTCTAANIAGLVALGARERPLILEDTCHLRTADMAGLQ